MSDAVNAVLPVYSNWPTENSSSATCKGRPSALGGAVGMGVGGRSSVTCTLAAVKRSSLSLPCSNDQACQARLTSRALTVMPSCCQSSWSIWPPARNEPVARSNVSGCDLPAQRSAVSSEPSVPAHHHRRACGADGQRNHAGRGPCRAFQPSPYGLGRGRCLLVFRPGFVRGGHQKTKPTLMCRRACLTFRP